MNKKLLLIFLIGILLFYSPIAFAQSPTQTQLCPPLGDINCSGKVDTADLLIILTNFGRSGSGDLNTNGIINTADLLLMMSNFGKTAQLTATPTPGGSGPCPATGGVINLDPCTKYQTFNRWEATAQAGQDYSSANFPAYQSALLDMVADGDINGNPVADGLGLNRLRIEVKKSGTGGFLSALNDYNLDGQIEKLAIPLRNRLAKKGETLWINVCVVGNGYKTDPNGYASAVLAVYQHMQQKYGFIPDSWELALEPDSFQWDDPLNLYNAMMATGTLLKANGFPTYFVAPSLSNATQSLSWFDRMMAMSNASQYLKEFAFHTYHEVTPQTLSAIGDRRKQYGIPTSQLEHINEDYIALHNLLKTANISNWQQYVLASPFTWNQGNDDGSAYYFQLTSSGPMKISATSQYTRQYTKYIKPGAIRMEATSSNSVLDPVAFNNANGKRVVVVLSTTLNGYNFTISGLPAGTYGISYTLYNQVLGQGYLYDKKLPDVTISSGQLLPVASSAVQLFGKGAITIYQK